MKERERENVQKSNMQMEVPLKKVFEKSVKVKTEQVVAEEVPMSGIKNMRRITPLADAFTSVPAETTKDIKTVEKEKVITESNDEDEFMLLDARRTESKSRKKMSIKDF